MLRKHYAAYQGWALCAGVVRKGCAQGLCEFVGMQALHALNGTRLLPGALTLKAVQNGVEFLTPKRSMQSGAEEHQACYFCIVPVP